MYIYIYVYIYNLNYLQFKRFRNQLKTGVGTIISTHAFSYMDHCAILSVSNGMLRSPSCG